MITQISEFAKLKYILSFPEGFEKEKKYPVIFFFHGAGGRGNDVEVLKTYEIMRYAENNKDFPFIIAAPLCTENTWFDLFENLRDFVKYIAEQDFTDTAGIYATGASMGGYATWQIAMSMPEYFAAIAPVCGGGMYWNAARLANMGVWAFHGAKDKTVLPEESEKMVNAVNTRGGKGNAKLTIYPERDHNAWTDTYSNPELYSWFLSHTRSNAEALSDNFKGTKLFG